MNRINGRHKMMRFAALAIAFVLFAGCGSNGFSAAYLSHTNISPEQRDITLITTVEALHRYSEQSRFTEASAEFKEKLDSYTAEFFEASMLIVINLWESSSSTQLLVKDLDFADTEVKVMLR